MRDPWAVRELVLIVSSMIPHFFTVIVLVYTKLGPESFSTASLMRGIPGYVTRIAVARILVNDPQAAISLASTHADVES
jgi:hypothetical protein